MLIFIVNDRLKGAKQSTRSKDNNSRHNEHKLFQIRVTNNNLVLI
jgi:hypothetical protein